MAKKVCLIDGSGYIFRAFYALPPLTSPQGIPINAVLGFMNMFMRLTAKIRCDYCLVLFDAKRQNFRNDIFAEYKGTRKDTPEDLIPQFPIIHRAVEVLNLNQLEMEGYEADDLIATYAKQAEERGYEVVVVSADKDLMQLIRPNVQFYDSMKDKFFTPEDVKEKFGVYPEKVVDVQALAGDSIDNVPGIPGIGLKTAADLINQFGSLEQVLERAAEIKQTKRRETLLANIDNAKISRKLVELKDDIDVKHDINDFPCCAPSLETVLSFVNEYGLKSVRPRVEKWVAEQSYRCGGTPQILSKEIEKKYQLIQDEADLKHWCMLISENRKCSLATLTSGPDPYKDKLIGLSLAIEPGKACYIPLSHQISTTGQDLFDETKAVKQMPHKLVVQYLRPLFVSKSVLKIGHNIKNDMHFLEQLIGLEDNVFPIEDTAVISYNLDSSEHGHSLSELAEAFLDYKLMPFETISGMGKSKISFAEINLEKVLPFAAEIADVIFRLYDVLKGRLPTEKQTAIYENFDRPLIPILKQMEDCGIMLDTNALMQLNDDFEEQLKKLEKEIFVLAGEEFNLGSPKQIGEILYGKLGLKGKKNASGSFQTGADVLERMAEEHELPAKILEWRGFSKLKTTYTSSLLASLDRNNRVHTTFSQITVNTGRLASSNPNLQNIPIRTDEGLKIRACFVAAPGHVLISADYSQVELRLLAEVANVQGLKEAFRHGTDVHTATASKVFGVPLEKVDANLRRHAKAINFGIVYGISQYGLAKQLDTSPEVAKNYIDSYFKMMPEIKDYMEKTIAFAHKNGYVLTPYGRKCSILGINDKNKRVVSFAERTAINAPIQGGAADIIKRAMQHISIKLGEKNYKTKMLLQVHDELVFEAPEEEVENVKIVIKECMENVVAFDIPFTADVGTGKNWAEAH